MTTPPRRPAPDAPTASRAARRAGADIARLVATSALLTLALAAAATADSEPGVAAPYDSAAIPAAAPAPTVAVRSASARGLDMETAALLLSGQQGGPLPIAVAARARGPAAEGDRVRVDVVIEVARSAVATAGSGPVALDVSIYAVGADGVAVEASRLETVTLAAAGVAAVGAAEGLRLVRELELPPGRHTLRVLVRHRATREVGLRVVALELPAATAPPPALLTPEVEQPATRWITPAEPEVTAPAPADELPSALPLLTARETARVRILAATGRATGPLRVELRASEGGAATAVPATVRSRSASARAGLERLDLDVALPALSAGHYTLRVASGTGVEGLASDEVAVFVTTGAAPASWTALVGAPPSPTSAPPATTRTRARPQRDAQTLAEYRAALAPAAAGDAAAALDAVAALDRKLLVEQNANPQELLALEVEALGELAPGDGDALVPVLVLYLDLYRREVRERAASVSTHAREMLFATAELEAKRQPEAASRKIAALALLAYVAAIPAGSSSAFAARALDRTLAFDPGNRAALLTRAVEATRLGDHAAAVDPLEALLDASPNDGEARLRLAVARARLAEKARARKLLRAVLEPAPAGDAPWWLPVAYQELARLELDAGDAAAAERTLRDGLSRLPGEEKLSLELAMALEQRHARAEAQEVLARLAPGRDGDHDAARRRFLAPPSRELDAVTAELRARGESGRARLAAALAARTSSGAGSER